MNKDVVIDFISKSKEKLNMAKLLIDNKGFDDAASRCYYSVFLIIQAVNLSKNLIFSSHKETIGAFNKNFIKEKIFPGDFSKKIEQLFRARQSGDYEVKKIIDYKTALESFENAKEILNKCEQYLIKYYNLQSL